MPVYDYLCAACGPFTEMRPMAECDDPQRCPGCAAPAPRAWLTAPALFGMSAARRRAHATNEQSRHAPQTAAAYKAKHGPGCGCCSAKPGRLLKKSATGAKSFPSARPWMISH